MFINQLINFILLRFVQFYCFYINTHVHVLTNTLELLGAMCINKVLHCILYNNQINVRALIGQSAMGYCAGKPTEKSRVFWIII